MSDANKALMRRYLEEVDNVNWTVLRDQFLAPGDLGAQPHVSLGCAGRPAGAASDLLTPLVRHFGCNLAETLSASRPAGVRRYPRRAPRPARRDRGP